MIAKARLDSASPEVRGFDYVAIGGNKGSFHRHCHPDFLDRERGRRSSVSGGRASLLHTDLTGNGIRTVKP